jgi:ATP-dependent DNA ligase
MQWIHEIKHDGYRLIARKQDDRVRAIHPPRLRDWTDIRNAVAALPEVSAVVDGEAVCCDDAGVGVFEMLHSRARDDQVSLYAFDLLEVDGEDSRPRPLEERKARLATLLTKAAGRDPIKRAPRRRRRGDLCARLSAGLRGHRLEASRAPLSIRPEQGLA